MVSGCTSFPYDGFVEPLVPRKIRDQLRDQGLLRVDLLREVTERIVAETISLQIRIRVAID